MVQKILRCPICVAERDAGQGNFTHHGTVEIYNRSKEDSDTGLAVRVDDQELQKGNRISLRNPSRRRNGIRIGFLCEAGHSFDLLIGQHKGSTLVSVDANGREFSPLLVRS